MEGISWKRAYAGSLLVHLAVAGLLAVGLAGSVAQHEQEKMYVVDLDASELTDSGSGHAGGGGGGGSAESLFPDKLSETDVAQRTAAVEAQSSALTPPEQAAQAQSVLADAAEKAAAPAAPAAPAAQAPSPAGPSDTGGSTAAVSDGGSGGGSGSGSGTGEGRGEGSGSGSGKGSGSGSGAGSGNGDGQGYGEGSGNGQGSGDSGAAGTGSAPFDSDGFWSAVNANKSYPPMAIKRGLTGTVTVTVVLDSSGNCVSASADSSGLLAKAAVNAVYAACPYPNGTGSTVTVHVPVTFNLQ